MGNLDLKETPMFLNPISNYTKFKPMLKSMLTRTGIFLFVQPFALSALIFCPPASAEQACVKTPLGKIVCGELQPKKESATTTSRSEQKQVVKTKSGIEFTLNGCKKSNAGLSCSISIYNSTDYDKRVNYTYAGGYSIIDSEGNKYASSVVSIGNQGLYATLPPKLTIKSYVVFQPNGKLTNRIRSLNVNPWVESNEFNVTFRDFNVN
jgi:hypothetical protein